jgi:hypothetical protein
VFKTAIRILGPAIVLLFLAPLGWQNASANVVNPAPAFQWIDAQGKPRPSSEFRGQPVIVVVASSPRCWGFRSQVGQLQRVYERLANTRTVVVAAFTGETGVIRSNIPFVLSANGPALAEAIAPGDRPRGTAIAIIGQDNNLDAVSYRTLPGQRILDIIGNSFVTQSRLRRE